MVKIYLTYKHGIRVLVIGNFQLLSSFLPTAMGTFYEYFYHQWYPPSHYNVTSESLKWNLFFNHLAKHLWPV